MRSGGESHHNQRGALGFRPVRRWRGRDFEQQIPKVLFI